MHFYQKNLATCILGGSILISLLLYGYILATITSPTTQLIRLEQFYALIAFLLLYKVLLIRPFLSVFTSFRYKDVLTASKKYYVFAIIYFASLHGSLSFFGQLEGFGGLAFLSWNYLLGITISFTALVFIIMYALLTYGWKLPMYKSERSSFILTGIGFLILLHALMLGSHFSDIASWIPLGFFFLTFLYLMLESIVVDQWLAKKYDVKVHAGLVTCFVVFAIGWYLYVLTGAGGATGLGIHAEHLGQENKTTTKKVTTQAAIRYNVDFDYPADMQPGVPSDLVFRVTTAETGELMTDFTVVSEKLMHVIIVDEGLGYFSHVHPELTEGVFSVTTTLPKNGLYRVYADFQPKNGIEQATGFQMSVGAAADVVGSTQEIDTTMSREVDGYTVSLSYPQPLSAVALSKGEIEMTYSITDSSGNPVTTLMPYLGSFGHMVMIHQKSYEYLHVHPAVTTTVGSDQTGGPTVSFYPLRLSGNVRPGIYRVFVQFNPNGQLITTDFTVRVDY